MSKTSKYMKNNEQLLSKDNNQHPVTNHSKGKLSSEISKNAKIKDEDTSIDLQWDF
jgi:hypothetical protein